jgi:hypothetical protein
MNMTMTAMQTAGVQACACQHHNKWVLPFDVTAVFVDSAIVQCSGVCKVPCCRCTAVYCILALTLLRHTAPSEIRVFHYQLFCCSLLLRKTMFYADDCSNLINQ